MNLTNVSNAIQMLQGWYSKAVKLGQIVGDNSYSDLTKETKVEPWVIVSKDCIGIEAMSDIMQGTLNYVIADYSQAVSLFGKIDDIKLRRTLGAFNPNRDGSAGALLASINLESFSDAAQMFSLPIGQEPTLEAVTGRGKDVQDEARNMSVGKLIDIPFVTGAVGEDGKQITVTLPIQFRLLVNYINSSSIVNLLSTGQDDTGFRARFERMMDIGDVRSALDFFTAQDMIEEKRRILYSEDGKFLQKILARKDANKRAALASRSPSLATLSNIFIITESEAKDLAYKMGGRKLDDEATREQIFRNISASTVIVIDRGWNNVTFYQRGFEKPSVLNFNQLKAQSSGKGPDLMDMFRQFNLGMPIG